MAAVYLRAVVVAHPALGQGIQFVDIHHRDKAQAAFKCRLHNIVAFFHLPLGTRIARLINLHMHIQRLAQVFKCRAGIGTAGVEHHHARHTAQRVFMHIGLGAHHVDKKVAQIGAGFAAEVVACHHRAAGMVGAGIAPHAVVFDFDHIARLVFIKLFLPHHPQPRIVTLARQVIEHAQTGVNLPAVVGVLRAHPAYRRGLQKLVGVQLVFAQCAGKRGFRQRDHFTRGLINAAGINLAVGTQYLCCLCYRHQPLAVASHGFHYRGRYQLRIGQAQLRAACIHPPLARRHHHHRFQLAV